MPRDSAAIASLSSAPSSPSPTRPAIPILTPSYARITVFSSSVMRREFTSPAASVAAHERVLLTNFCFSMIASCTSLHVHFRNGHIRPAEGYGQRELFVFAAAAEYV